MDMQQFQVDSTDPGRDVAEGELAYKIVEENGKFLLVEYLPSEPYCWDALETCDTRQQAEAEMREYLAIRQSSKAADDDDAA